MRARDVMSRRVVTIRPDAPVQEAWDLMHQNRIHHLVVTDSAKCLGLIAQSDVGTPDGGPLRDRLVSDVMTADVVTVSEASTVRQLANAIRGHATGCVVVTKRGRPEGIITTADLLELLGRGATHPSKDVERRNLHHRTPHRRTTTPSGLW